MIIGKHVRPVIQSNDPRNLHEDLEQTGQEVLLVDGLQVTVEEGHHVLHHLVQSWHKAACRHCRGHWLLQGSSAEICQDIIVINMSSIMDLMSAQAWPLVGRRPPVL